MYKSNQNWQKIEFTDPIPYWYTDFELSSGNFRYVPELLRGYHVYENFLPTNEREIVFISVPGTREAFIQNDTLFASNHTDQVLFDISDPRNINFIGRISGQYSTLHNQRIPGEYFGLIECPNTNSEEILGWTIDSIFRPKCFRQ